jgi:hypothetical protein
MNLELLREIETLRGKEKRGKFIDRLLRLGIKACRQGTVANLKTEQDFRAEYRTMVPE